MLIEVTWKRAAIAAGIILVLIVGMCVFSMSDTQIIKDVKHSTGIGTVHVTIAGVNNTWGTTYQENFTIIPGQDGAFVTVGNNTSAYQVVIKP
jgi:hypothetical protein